MITCLDQDNKPVYINKLEDFRELVSYEVYLALDDFVNSIESEVDFNSEDYKYELERAEDVIDDLEQEIDSLEDEVKLCKEVIYLMLNRLYNNKPITYDELEDYIDRNNVYLELDYDGSDIYKEDYKLW